MSHKVMKWYRCFVGPLLSFELTTKRPLTDVSYAVAPMVGDDVYTTAGAAARHVDEALVHYAVCTDAKKRRQHNFYFHCYSASKVLLRCSELPFI